MAYLINRNPAARFTCLHSLLRYVVEKSKMQSSLGLSDFKYDADKDNVLNYCPLLTRSDFGVDYCPYLQNPLSEAGCNMTNGVDCDSTKSKEVSNTVNALHALGFVKRSGRTVVVTQLGFEFASVEMGTANMQSIIKGAVVRYGPVVGVLKQIADITTVGGSFNTSDLYVGYPCSNETVVYKGSSVTISSGSQDDSNTRTKSCVLAWLTAGGYIRPDSLPALKSGEFAHSKYQDFLNQPHRGDRKYILVSPAPFMTNARFITEAPLDYNNLTKLTGALRENNMADVREATMLFEPRIKNRRLAIIYLLNKAFEQNKQLEYKKIIECLRKDPELFVVNQDSLEDCLEEEIKIATMSGIPFSITLNNGDINLRPFTGINTKELLIGAPTSVVGILNKTTI